MEENIIDIDGLSEEEVKEVEKIFQRFLQAYKDNREKEPVDWLKEQLQKELPEEPVESIEKMAQEIVESITSYDENLEQLNESCKKGITKESWLAEKMQDGAKGMALNQFGEYLYEIDNNLEIANCQMLGTILRKDMGTSEALNLDGFIAEQYHVNEFNAKAALEKSMYRAKVCVPKGKYAKNSVDVMIGNVETGENGIERYQFVYGKDAKTTIQILKRGDYRNQRLVVPKEQLTEIQNEFPNKTVTDHIGGTEKIDIASSALTKEEVKEMQNQVQNQHRLPETNWNSYQTKELALNIGKQAGKAGIFAALVGGGVHVAAKAISGEKIEADKVVKTAIEMGSDTCVKAAAGGALKVAVEKGTIKLIPRGTPISIITTMACVGVENAKILWKVAKGEITMSEAMEYMGRTSVSMLAGFEAAVLGTAIGVTVLGWIPIVGAVVGGVVGGIVGYAAGSKVGETVFEGAKTVAKKGIELVKKGARAISNIGETIKNKWRSVLA